MQNRVPGTEPGAEPVPITEPGAEPVPITELLSLTETKDNNQNTAEQETEKTEKCHWCIIGVKLRSWGNTGK